VGGERRQRVGKVDGMTKGKLNPQRTNNEMRGYKKKERLFLQKGFTEEICRKIIPIALSGCHPLFFLFCYGQNIPDSGTYLEIGSARGGSLMCIFLASQSVGRTVNLIGIDPDPNINLGYNTRNISNLRFIKKMSDEVKDDIADNSVDLLYIDGEHSYEQVKRDIQNYLPKVKKEGLVIGDDYNLPGVKMAADEAFGKKLEILHKTNFWVIKKKDT